MNNRTTLFIFACLLAVLGRQTVSAQGSIFGEVHRPDLSVPADSQLIFFGFVGNDDNEIRLWSSVGAGYDAGNWYDDFQNYVGATAGQRYDFFFFDTSALQAAHLDGSIPNNSFQQEDVVLNIPGWPLEPQNPDAVWQGDSVLVSWTGHTSFDYTVYRREISSQGSFMRVGYAPFSNSSDQSFVDNTAINGTDYTYLILAWDSALNVSAPTALTSSSQSCCQGNTGNVNNDPLNETDIADLTTLIDHLFIAYPPLACPEAGNVDGDLDGTVDIADLTTLIDHLFITYAPTAPCP